jgi:serine/threonine-protein kinase
MSLPGEVLGARWALDEKIDAGAMGEIFRGRHRVLGHTVAVKVMIPDAARDGATTERFLREARIAARLRHPHVVRVEDFGVADDGRSYLVMELLRGESLARRLARAPRLTSAEVLRIVRQLGEALDVAHAEGIVHRDLKPENIFLCDVPDGAPIVKVLDFGVAKFTDTLSEGGHATASNALIGTPKYMSPEQARSSRDLDGRSDLWAVGMLVYEMLTGRHPFEGEAIAELLVAILTEQIAPPSSVCPSLPPSLDVWMGRALARSRADRFPSGRALSEALEDALAGRVSESWCDTWSPQEPPRRATLRVRRPTADTPSELRATDPPPAAPAVAPPPRDPRKESMELRTSWRSGLLAGLVAASAIFGLARLRESSRPRTAASSPTAMPAAAVTPAAVAPAPRRLAVPEAVSEPVAPAPSLAAPGPEPEASVENPRAGRHRNHRHRHRRTQVPPSATTPTAPGGGMYDPSGI